MGGGWSWGSIAAARQRFVGHERTRGSIISRGHASCGYRLKAAVGAGLRHPLQPASIPCARGPPAIPHSCRRRPRHKSTNLTKLSPIGDKNCLAVTCTVPARESLLIAPCRIGSRRSNVLPERGVMQRSERLFVGVPQMQAVLWSGSNTKRSDTNHAAVPAGPASSGEATTPVRWAPRHRGIPMHPDLPREGRHECIR
jgi:hypothetical protein